MGDFKINEKTVFTQSGSAEPAMGSTVTDIPAAGVTGVLPVGVTGGSGLTALGTVASGVIGASVTGGAGLTGSTSLGTVTAGNLSNTNIVYPTGHIIQIVEGTSTSQATSSSTSWVDTGVAAAITPSSTSNKIFVVSNVQGVRSPDASGVGLRVLKDSTPLYTPGKHNVFFGTGGGYSGWSDTYLDSPDTTSSVTYKIQFASLSASFTFYVQQGNQFRSSITLMEVKG